MRKRGLKMAAAVLASVASIATIGVALAQTGKSSRTTNFQSPTWVPNTVDCVWAETHAFGAKDTQHGQDDDGGTGWDWCVPAKTRQAHSEATADGEQIEAYGWAYDSCVGDFNAATSAVAHGKNDTSFTITLVSTPPGTCYSLMRVDMRPWFKARVDVDAPGSASAHGMMLSSCPAINHAVADIDGTAHSDGGVHNSSWSFSTRNASGSVGAGITTTGGVGGGSVEKAFTTYVGDQLACNSATVYVACTVDVSVTADAEGDWFDTSEAEAWVWDSKPGVDLHASCPITCQAYAYWNY